MRGRLMRFHKVLGSPAELPQVVRQLEVHGVHVDRIVVTEPFDQLSSQAQEALLRLERSSEIKVDWIVETLGLREDRTAGAATPSEQTRTMFAAAEPMETAERLARYELTKRGFDVVAASLLGLFLAPLMLVVALVVAIDVGLPVVFWQKRPGRHGRPFKLYKFCTMRAAHDADGRRVADEDRLSLVGQLLRRTRLDELPQLYNVLLGDMSFVGPRPLLPEDQPAESQRAACRSTRTYGACPGSRRAHHIARRQECSRLVVRSKCVLVVGCENPPPHPGGDRDGREGRSSCSNHRADGA